jgi:hypothetical protein
MAELLLEKSLENRFIKFSNSYHRATRLVAVVPVEFTRRTWTGKIPTGTLLNVTTCPPYMRTVRFPVTPT